MPFTKNSTPSLDKARCSQVGGFSLSKTDLFLEGWVESKNFLLTKIEVSTKECEVSVIDFSYYTFDRKDVLADIASELRENYDVYGYRLLISTEAEIACPVGVRFYFEDHPVSEVSLRPDFDALISPRSKLEQLIQFPASYKNSTNLLQDIEYIASVYQPAVNLLSAPIEEILEPFTFSSLVHFGYISDDHGALLLGRAIHAIDLPKYATVEVLNLASKCSVQIGRAQLRTKPGIDVISSESSFFVLLPPSCLSQMDLAIQISSSKVLNLSVPKQGAVPPCEPETLLEILNTCVKSIRTGEAFDSENLSLIARGIDQAQSLNFVEPETEEEITFGSIPKSPEVSLIIPVYNEYHLVRQQILDLADDEFIKKQEVIFVVDSPDSFQSLVGLLRGQSLFHKLPFRLIKLRTNSGFAGTCNHGAKCSAAPRLLFLNSDVFPRNCDWLQHMISVLDNDSDVGAVGAKLLYGDESIQHAGISWKSDPDMEFLIYNMHPFKGLPSQLLPEGDSCEVPAVTAACMLVSRSDFQDVGGFDTGYINGDFEDSDICLKLRENGKSIRCDHNIGLYHLEGASYPSDRRQRVFHYNCIRHGYRWGPLIRNLSETKFSPDSMFGIELPTS